MASSKLYIIFHLLDLPLNMLQLCEMTVLCMVQTNLKRFNCVMFELSLGCQFLYQGKRFIYKQGGKFYKTDATSLRWKLCSNLTWGLCPTIYLILFFSKLENISQYNTRSKDRFNVPKYRLDLLKNHLY